MTTLKLLSRFTLARWVFARTLGLVFFSAFVSLGVQIRGLAGARGIVPAQQFLDAVWNQNGAAALYRIPTLCWWDASDTTLVTFCVVGAIVSLVLVWGVLPGLCSLILWALYLSLCWVATPFTNFQWDALLLETALPAALLLPWRFRPRWNQWGPVQQAALWALWWLLFRLMFESGVVKLTAGDSTWWGLTALDYHFETQPLPLWTAWYANQLPEWILCLSTFAMFLIELLAPFLIFAPGRWRHGGAWALIALQIGILTTGNYAFFNWLTIALCLLLLNDSAWPARLRARLQPEAATVQAWTPLVLGLTGPAMLLVLFLTMQPFVATLLKVRRWPAALGEVREVIEPFLSCNDYGLFRVMTTSRHEIVVEGSDDGEHWREYEFRWKPGDLNERPHLVAPHQPRLDWQMWFAALGSTEGNQWFLRFLVRLLEGSPEVLDLLRSNPFPDHPPRYIRPVAYDYHFTRFDDGHTGWWKRKPLGPFSRTLTLKNGQPTIVEQSPPQAPLASPEK